MSDLNELKRQRAALDQQIADEEARLEEERSNARIARVKALVELMTAKPELRDVLVPNHTRTSCSDANPTNVGRCDRCTMLEARTGVYGDEYEIEFHIRRRDQD